MTTSYIRLDDSTCLLFRTVISSLRLAFTPSKRSSSVSFASATCSAVSLKAWKSSYAHMLPSFQAIVMVRAAGLCLNSLSCCAPELQSLDSKGTTDFPCSLSRHWIYCLLSTVYAASAIKSISSRAFLFFCQATEAVQDQGPILCSAVADL